MGGLWPCLEVYVDWLFSDSVGAIVSSTMACMLVIEDFLLTVEFRRVQGSVCLCAGPQVQDQDPAALVDGGRFTSCPSRCW